MSTVKKNDFERIGEANFKSKEQSPGWEREEKKK